MCINKDILRYRNGTEASKRDGDCVDIILGPVNYCYYSQYGSFARRVLRVDCRRFGIPYLETSYR